MCKLPDGRDWWWEKLGLALMGKAVLSKALIQLSADQWGGAVFLLVIWPEMTQLCGLDGRVSGNLQEDLCQGIPSRTAAASTPLPTASHC